jgi:hypothetical protein
MLETCIVMSLLIFCLVLLLMLHLVSFIDLTIAHGFGSRENSFVPRCFAYDPRSHHGDHPLRRHGFTAGGSFTRFEPRHFNGSRFPRRGSCRTHSIAEVLKTMKTSSGHMAKCWIPKFYLTNLSTERSTSSHPV